MPTAPGGRKGQKGRQGKALCRVAHQGSTVRDLGLGSGLKSRMTAKIWTKKGGRGRAGFGLMEALLAPGTTGGWRFASRHGKSPRV